MKNNCYCVLFLADCALVDIHYYVRKTLFEKSYVALLLSYSTRFP